MDIILKSFFSILFIINIFNPKALWSITDGLKYKNAEPTDFYLFIIRIGNILGLIAIWFFNLFS